MMSVQNDRNSCGGCKSAVLGGEVPEELVRKRKYMEDLFKQAAQMVSQRVLVGGPKEGEMMMTTMKSNSAYRMHKKVYLFFITQHQL